MRRISVLIMLGVFTFMLVSCSSVVSSSQEDFSIHGWLKDNPVQLEFECTDTSSTYDILLELVCDEDYYYSNLWLQFQLLHPDNHKDSSLVEFILSDDLGVWYTEKSSFSPTYQFRKVINKSVKFPQKGSYTLSVSQYMRIDTLVGVESLSLQLKESTPQSASKD